MAHVPHLLLPGPWSETRIELPGPTVHHLRSVLRMHDGEACSYTDGAGRGGEGVLEAGAIVRGDESVFPAPPTVILAVAPPASKDRLRIIVEKAAEIGVSRIRWLDTRFGNGRPPRADKSMQWAQMALEQSRGHHLTTVDEELVSVDALEGNLVAADQGGATPATMPAPLTVLVGPEGGWAPGELPEGIPTFGLGDRVLRTETAAILAAFVARSVAV